MMIQIERILKALEDASAAIRQSADRVAELEAENARLREALAAYSRLTMPHIMALAQLELLDKPLKDDDVLYSFMGSGASDRVTVGDLRKAQDLARSALPEIDNG